LASPVGQPVLRGERLQRELRPLLVGHVAQRFDHRDQTARFVMDGAGIDGEIELIAEFWHHAPVLGAQAHAGVARTPLGIERGELVRPIERHEIRQAIAALPVEGAPMSGRAQHLGRGDTG
jgi:hypothetical protein